MNCVNRAIAGDATLAGHPAGALPGVPAPPSWKQAFRRPHARRELILMNDVKLMTFGEVLLNIANSSGTAWVYLPIEKKWNLNSKCAILESEEVPPELEDNPDAGVPEFAKRNRLMQVLPVTVVQDVVANARMQKSSATLEDFLKGFLYYHKHDAFIELTN